MNAVFIIFVAALFGCVSTSENVGNDTLSPADERKEIDAASQQMIRSTPDSRGIQATQDCDENAPSDPREPETPASVEIGVSHRPGEQKKTRVYTKYRCPK